MWDSARKKMYDAWWSDKKNGKWKKVELEPLLTVDLDLKKGYAANKNAVLKAVEHEEVKYKNKNKYFKSFSGVWAVVSGDIVYDVAETSSVCDEMVKFLYFLCLAKKDARKNVYKNYKKNVYRRYKAQQIYKSLGRAKKLQFALLERDLSKEERQDSEFNYACRFRSPWWSPSPEQMKKVQNCGYL